MPDEEHSSASDPRPTFTVEKKCSHCGAYYQGKFDGVYLCPACRAATKSQPRPARAPTADGEAA